MVQEHNREWLVSALTRIDGRKVQNEGTERGRDEMIEVEVQRPGFHMRLHLAAEGSAVETDFMEIHRCRKLNRMLLVCSIPSICFEQGRESVASWERWVIE